MQARALTFSHNTREISSGLFTRTDGAELLGVNAGVPDPIIGYVYNYDGANRLTAAASFIGASWTPTNNYALPLISYDANGNIEYLKRNDNNGALVDDFDYTYQGTNRLASITNRGSYTYDNNGNMITDTYNGISLIQSYDSRMGRSLSVDRFSDKDPSRSPYSYAGNNPIIFYDANGDSVEVYYEIIGGSDYGRVLSRLVDARHAYVRVETDQFDFMIERTGDGSLDIKPFDPTRGGIKSKVEEPSEEVDYSFENDILHEFFKYYMNEGSLPKYFNDPTISFEILKGFGNYPIIFPVIGGTFNNSNTFAKYLIEHAGGSIKNIPSTAFGSYSKFK